MELLQSKRRNFHYRLKKYFNIFTAKDFSNTRPLMHLNKHVFRSQQLQKYLSYEADFFFSKRSKFDLDSKNATKMMRFFLVFQIIAFKLVAVNSPYHYENTHVLTYLLLPIIQRECDTFCCGHTDSFNYHLCCSY